MKNIDKEVRVLALATYPVEAACSRYRLVQFIEPLARRGVRLTYRPFIDSRTFSTLYDTRRAVRNALRLGLMLLRRCGDVLHAMRADVVFIQRDAVLFGPPIFEFLITRVLRRPMILDLDDATWLPAPSPVYGRIAKMLKPSWKTDLLIRWSRVVICGNEAIASHVRQLGTEAKVLPTIVDVDIFRPRCEGNDNPVPVVGWIGSHSTYSYLETVLPALAEAAGRHPFKLLIVGSGRERTELSGSDLDLRAWSLDREIDDFLTLDIGLYPLADDAWSSAKSGFKAVQYMAVGVPYVVTPVGVCAQLGVKGETHLEARTMKEWAEAVEELLASPGRRQRMGAAGRRYATEHFSIERQADAIADIFRAHTKQPARKIDGAMIVPRPVRRYESAARVLDRRDREEYSGASPAMRVTHVITGLGVGGAESMLYKLLMTMDRRRFEPSVISLSSELAFAERIRALDIPLATLKMPRSILRSPRALVTLYEILRKQRPHLVQTWMYHSDLLGGTVAKLTGVPVVWNIRTSSLDSSSVSARTRMIVRLCARLSRHIPRVIVSCSQAGEAIHVAAGYDPSRFRVIPNGTDIAVFAPDARSRAAMRCALCIDGDTPVIGMVARFDSQKDHGNFLAAATILLRTHDKAVFVLCGPGMTEQNEMLRDMIDAHAIPKRNIRLLGVRRDIQTIMPAFDVHALSSSWGEGFPNVVAEAMASGVPCVATDVGDSAFIIGDAGRVVPPRDPEALAGALREIIDLAPHEWEALRAKARARVVEDFGLPAVVAQYESLYEEIVGTQNR